MPRVEDPVHAAGQPLGEIAHFERQRAGAGDFEHHAPDVPSPRFFAIITLAQAKNFAKSRYGLSRAPKAIAISLSNGYAATRW